MTITTTINHRRRRRTRKPDTEPIAFRVRKEFKRALQAKARRENKDVTDILQPFLEKHEAEILAS